MMYDIEHAYGVNIDLNTIGSYTLVGAVAKQFLCTDKTHCCEAINIRLSGIITLKTLELLEMNIKQLDKFLSDNSFPWIYRIHC